MFPSDMLKAVLALDAYMKRGNPTHQCLNCRARGRCSSCKECGASAARIPVSDNLDEIEGITVYVIEIRDGEVHHYNPDDDKDTPGDENF